MMYLVGYLGIAPSDVVNVQNLASGTMAMAKASIQFRMSEVFECPEKRHRKKARAMYALVH